jgi:hypothetical protein
MSRLSFAKALRVKSRDPQGYRMCCDNPALLEQEAAMRKQFRAQCQKPNLFCRHHRKHPTPTRVSIAQLDYCSA